MPKKTIRILFLTLFSIGALEARATSFAVSAPITVEDRVVGVTYLCRNGNDSRGEIVNMGSKGLTSSQIAAVGAAALERADTICKSGRPAWDANKKPTRIDASAPVKTEAEAKANDKQTCYDAGWGIGRSQVPPTSALGGTTADECKSTIKDKSSADFFASLNAKGGCANAASFDKGFQNGYKRTFARDCDQKFKIVSGAFGDTRTLKPDGTTDTILCNFGPQMFDQVTPEKCEELKKASAAAAAP